MASTKILVTGGAGYIGSHTVVELVNAGYEPVILDNFMNSRPFIVQNLAKILGRPVRLHRVDSTDPVAVSRVFEEEGDIRGVIHFAALKAVGDSVLEPLLYYRVNLMSLVTVMEAAIRFKADRFVFSSSAAVYGAAEEMPVTEETPLQSPESPYGNTKKIAEEILKDAVRAGMPLKTVALRYFNPVGAHASALIGELPLGVPRNLVPFVTQTAAGLREKLVVFGNDYNTPDGSCIRDYIHVVDLARAHVRTLEYLDKQPCSAMYDVFNIGTGNGASVLELLRLFQEVTGGALNYVIGPRRAGDIETLYADTGKANRLLGWRAELSLKESLKSSWAWQVSLSQEKF